MVATEAGQTAIENVKLGDHVWAWDQEANLDKLFPVVGCFAHRRAEVLVVKAGHDSFWVTGEHAFYVKGKGWTRSRDLLVGDELATLGSAVVTVELVEQEHGSFVVYNFEVGRAHNYYVGDQAILTHNLGALALRKKLGILKKPNLAAHHIVARRGGGADGRAARRILKDFGIGLDTTVNGVALPKNTLVRAPKGYANAARHSVIHTGTYYEALRKELELAKASGGGRNAVKFALRQIGDRLRLGCTHPLGEFPY